MRRLKTLIAGAVAVALLSGCGAGAAAPAPSGAVTGPAAVAPSGPPSGETLVVYTNSNGEGRGEWLTKKAAEAGFKIEIVGAGGADATNKLIAEKNNPIADVAFGLNNMYFDQINQIEGRVSPERRLLADDFYKLFFGGESFSASGGNYQVRLWPPEVTPPLNPLQPEQERQTTSALWDTAEKPFLFWKTKDEEARVPDSLDQVKDHVEQAWKKLKARDKAALAEVKTVAVALEKKSGADYGPVLQELEKKLGREAIYLKKIAPWSPFLSGQRKLFYGEYALPKGLIDYPPEDLVKQLLTLPDLSKPFQTGNKEIDALNLQLFEDGKKLPTVEGVGKYVQVVANKPRTVFYVACVVRQGTPDFRYFADECFRKAASPNLDAYDPFLDRCQNEAAKQFREAFLQQLRSEQKVKVTDDKKVRDSFDSATSS